MSNYFLIVPPHMYVYINDYHRAPNFCGLKFLVIFGIVYTQKVKNLYGSHCQEYIILEESIEPLYLLCIILLFGLGMQLNTMTCPHSWVCIDTRPSNFVIL